MTEKNIGLRQKVMEALSNLWHDESVTPDKTAAALRHSAESALSMANRVEDIRVVNKLQSRTPNGAEPATCPACQGERFRCVSGMWHPCDECNNDG